MDKIGRCKSKIAAKNIGKDIVDSVVMEIEPSDKHRVTGTTEGLVPEIRREEKMKREKRRKTGR